MPNVPRPAVSVAEVQALADAAEQVDAVAPLSEATLLALSGDDPADRWWPDHDAAGRLRAFGYLRREEDGGSWGELVVHPGARRRGVGRDLLRHLTDAEPGVRVWAHGDLPGARALAAAAGGRAVRDLWRMARPADADPPIEAPAVPAGFTVRAFRPGRDEHAWLRVNSRAFVDHPEQGRMTLNDLEQRMDQPWFDPAGLLLIEDVTGAQPVLAGSHWTKIADPSSGAGEVYVVAVDPDYQGRGLGAPVTAAGLHHLAGRGVRTIDLYVEGDNTRAIATYRRWGFERVAHDVMYAAADTPEGGL